ncbi:MAG: citrate/2-methylcitrate synthase [Planctomycetes bacterium]|nr:citrate/2-methylcitrate synthase [Planctomycetota bacterium]
MISSVVAKGLEGVVVAETNISYIDGQKGKLYYRGYSIQDLARHSNFEETSFLLLYGHLPSSKELQQFNSELRSHYFILPEVIQIIEIFGKSSNPMDLLRVAVCSMGCFEGLSNSYNVEKNNEVAKKLIASFPTIVATLWNIKHGKRLVFPNHELSLAENFLYMLTGKIPDRDSSKLLDMLLIIHADHGMNASTFTARTIISSVSDVYSAIVGAIGSLKGPLHGGANQNAYKVIYNDIKSADVVDSYVDNALASKQRIPGFGHRVYKCEDPRAVILRDTSIKVADTPEKKRMFEITRKIEEAMVQKKNLYPNVDLYSPSCYYSLGIDVDLYTCLFAMGRISGWCAHIIEQLKDNRLIRPSDIYTGGLDSTYVPIESR